MKGEPQVKKAAESVGAGIAEKKADSFDAAIKRATKKGATAKDTLGLTDAMVEGIYGQAYRLYNTGRYKDAVRIFRLLLMINATEPKYIMGLAACYHMTKEYKAAVEIYSMASVVDANSPVPLYHASDCYMKMGDNPAALIALEMAVKRAGERAEFKTLKDRALMTIASLKKEFSAETKQ
jgi:type III secretion system low calcium response chaperone LcrH/SycD